MDLSNCYRFLLPTNQIAANLARPQTGPLELFVDTNHFACITSSSFPPVPLPPHSTQSRSGLIRGARAPRSGPNRLKQCATTIYRLSRDGRYIWADFPDPISAWATCWSSPPLRPSTGSRSRPPFRLSPVASYDLSSRALDAAGRPASQVRFARLSPRSLFVCCRRPRLNRRVALSSVLEAQRRYCTVQRQPFAPLPFQPFIVGSEPPTRGLRLPVLAILSSTSDGSGLCSCSLRAVPARR